ncbi:hypothetical protein AVEN_17910-1 [Araneus ventricosus]|uniref:Uncharacterized protein n=1 Tax=Araneus ventricosus TaxID=182803 RepID=A0A4Y2V1D5_ARAVE|nr:hypothetical protein AVEN_17910-1 [Araneus ventricosus]
MGVVGTSSLQPDLYQPHRAGSCWNIPPTAWTLLQPPHGELLEHLGQPGTSTNHRRELLEHPPLQPDLLTNFSTAGVAGTSSLQPDLLPTTHRCGKVVGTSSIQPDLLPNTIFISSEEANLEGWYQTDGQVRKPSWCASTTLTP